MSGNAPLCMLKNGWLTASHPGLWERSPITDWTGGCVCSGGGANAIQKKDVSIRQNSKSDSPVVPLAAQSFYWPACCGPS